MESIKLFLYANSYAARTILYHADYLFNFSVSEVYLLTENHTNKENLHRNNNINHPVSDDPLDMIDFVYDII